MQLVKCDVRLYGDTKHVVAGKIVAVPEIPILRHMHGSDAVVNVVPAVKGAKIFWPAADLEAQGADYKPYPTTNEQWVEHLREHYTDRVFSEVYPGAMPTLPATLRQIGVDPKLEAERLRKVASEASAAADSLAEQAVQTLVIEGEEEDEGDKPESLF